MQRWNWSFKVASLLLNDLKSITSARDSPTQTIHCSNILIAHTWPHLNDFSQTLVVSRVSSAVTSQSKFSKNLASCKTTICTTSNSTIKPLVNQQVTNIVTCTPEPSLQLMLNSPYWKISCVFKQFNVGSDSPLNWINPLDLLPGSARQSPLVLHSWPSISTYILQEA